MAHWALTAAVFGVCFSYVFYPLILLLLKDRYKTRQSQIEKARGRDRISFIITVHNEESRIEQKIRETIELSRPYNSEVLVASDSSTDRTNQIVELFEKSNVVLVRSEGERGKEVAQKIAVERACGEILVFSDAGCSIASGSIQRILEIFDDPGVGSISSVDKFVSKSGQPEGEGLYIKYEMWLRGLETRKGGVIGLSGSFFAARKEICSAWNTRIPSDFNIAMNTAQLGYMAVSDPGVIGIYSDLKNVDDEFRRKVRTVIRGMSALAENKKLLNPFQYGLISFKLWGHKIARWLVPWMAVLTIWVAASLAGRSWAGVFILALSIMFGLFWSIAAFWPSLRKKGWIGTIYYFIQTNIAVAIAGIKFALGHRVTYWTPSNR